MINNKRKCLYTLIYFSKVLFFKKKSVYFRNINLFNRYLNILAFHNDR